MSCHRMCTLSDTNSASAVAQPLQLGLLLANSDTAAQASVPCAKRYAWPASWAANGTVQGAEASADGNKDKGASVEMRICASESAKPIPSKSELEITQDVHDFSKSGLSRQTPYLPGFLSYDVHTGTQEARCTGARFEPGPGRVRGVCRSRPANTQEKYES